MQKKLLKTILIFTISILVTFNIFAGDRPKVALVLAGGGAKGYVHIGTIELLEKYGIPVDYVVGTSMGALVGGLYAAGYSSEDMVRAVRQTDIVNSVFNIKLNDPIPTIDSITRKNNFSLGFDSNGITSKTGFVDDTLVLNVLNRFMRKVSTEDNFDNFYRAFRAVAVDFNTGEVIPLKSGHVVEAMRASMSIPVAFPVFKVNNRYLVDGGVKENVPINTAITEFNPDIIIVSDCTGSRFRVAKGVDTRTKLDEGVIGLSSVITQSMMLGNATSDETKRELSSKADLVVEYDTSMFNTASFSSFEDILAQSRKDAIRNEPKFIELAEKLKSEGVELNPSSISRYNILENPHISTVVISGNERYRKGMNDELYDRFSKFKDVVLNDENTIMLEKTIKEVQDFYGMSYLYYNINKITSTINQLEIKFDFPPIRKHNLFVAGDIKLSLQMTKDKNGSYSESALSQFGFSFFPELEFGYRYLPNPEKTMNSVTAKLKTTGLLKDNSISVYYTHTFNTDGRFVMFVSPKLSFYAGMSSLEASSEMTNLFSNYDYGFDVNTSFGYLNKYNIFLMTFGFDYLYFGERHVITLSERRHMLKPYLEFSTVFGRKDYHVLDFNTGYRAEVNGYLGVDFGREFFNDSDKFTLVTRLPYSFQVRLEGTWRVHDYFTIGGNVEFGTSRKPFDLSSSFYDYGDIKGMPGFSLNDKAFDYYLASLNLYSPLSINDAVTPGFIIRFAIGSRDAFVEDYYNGSFHDVDLNSDYGIFGSNSNYVPFSHMRKLNVGLGAYFGLHTAFADVIIGAGYEFMDNKVSISLEVW